MERSHNGYWSGLLIHRGLNRSEFESRPLRHFFTMKKRSEEPAYLVEHSVIKILKYNHRYGDDRICKCGHPYYRHFDTYDEMEAVGCKYCDCYEFEEKEPS